MSPEEREVIKPIVERALAKGYVISVNDGEDWSLRRSSSVSDILNTLGATDEEVLVIYNPAELTRIGWIQLIYGNAPDEVVCDYTDTDTHIMREIVDGPDPAP